MSQLAFKWPARASLAPEDFIVSGANEAAAHLLETWPHGESHIALLSGPEACGKTHLSACWVARTGAVLIDRKQLGTRDSQALWGEAAHAVLEDIHAVSDQTALFHLLRYAETHGRFLLLTSRLSAERLEFTLPDLRSRLRASPAAVIEAPDENLLKGFLFKCLSDRQLRAGNEVIDYLAARMERSFASALRLADALEARALGQGRDITIPLVKGILT